MKKIYLLVFILGVSLGAIFVFSKARATTSDGQVSGGEQPASVYYDETWQASNALISASGGYANYNPLTNTETGVAGKFESGEGGWKVKISPKMVVTKWKVHGHIHFQ